MPLIGTVRFCLAEYRLIFIHLSSSLVRETFFSISSIRGIACFCPCKAGRKEQTFR